MNEEQRKVLEVAIENLGFAKVAICEVQVEEQGKFDNLSEELQATKKSQKIEESASLLKEDYFNIDVMISSIQYLIN